jgi:hypothetical protein
VIWPWIIAQVLMVLYVRFAAWHHTPAVNAMREYVPTPNPYEDPFHFWSWFQAALLSLALACGLLSYYEWFWCLSFGKLCVAWYWLLFDPWLNNGTGKDWDYLGSDAGLDGWLRRNFGKKAGKIKAAIMTLSIILINLLFFM